MTLPIDVTRCQGGGPSGLPGCQKRDRCERYLGRNDFDGNRRPPQHELLCRLSFHAFIPAGERERFCCRACFPDVPIMILCPDCGNKRCAKAANHNNACTGSNEPGQPGSEDQS